MHLAIGPFVRKVPEAVAQQPPSGIVYLVTPQPLRVEPTPTPTPRVISTPRLVVAPHVVQTVAPVVAVVRRPPVRVRAPRAVAVASGAPVEAPGPAGSPGASGGGSGGTDGGGGVGAGGDGAGRPAATFEPTPPPTPSPTPKPMCANPEVDARAIDTVEPSVPEIARQQGATGTTNVKVDLSETGAVVGVSIAKSAGNPALDTVALYAARHSTYAPEIRACRAVPGSYLFRVEFDG